MPTDTKCARVCMNDTLSCIHGCESPGKSADSPSRYNADCLRKCGETSQACMKKC